MARHAKGELAKQRRLGVAWLALIDALPLAERKDLIRALSFWLHTVPMAEGRYPIELARPLLDSMKDAAHGETP